MPDYLQDLDLNSDKDVHLDGANDLALTSGKANLEQSIEINASDAINEFVGSRITGTSIALLEEDLKRALNDDPQVGNVANVNVVEFDKRTDTIALDVFLTENKEFQIEVSP